jgi:YVTN family beta-propeller protein
MRSPFGLLSALVVACRPPAAHPDAGLPPDDGQPQIARSLALNSEGSALWVVNPESDSVSEIDLASRTLVHEFLLGSRRPAVDAATGRYDPAIRPRSIALAGSTAKAYVAGQAANAVFVVSTSTGEVLKAISVGAEPVAVVASRDGSAVYVVNHQSSTVQKIDTASDRVVATLTVGPHPWGASLRSDGSRLYVSHLLLSPSVSVIETSMLSLLQVTALPAQQPHVSSKLVPNGEPREAFAVVPRPNDGELWVPHVLLSTTTAQPDLDFESTVFPTVSRLAPGGVSFSDRLLFRPTSLPNADGAFTDVVSGPRDVAFTPDGRTALVAMAQSEDVMVFDAATGFEVGLVRPTPSGLLEGVVVDATGTRAYVHGRSTHDVTVLSITSSEMAPQVTVDPGAPNPIECLESDPMPAQLRRGMRLFFSSNSAMFPITRNFWVACASCHPEGRTDAVVWRFKQGPRDTPSNARGPINTGFLFLQAVRNSLVDYDETIRVEQGGSYSSSNPSQLPDLEALGAFVNDAIPFPQNPYLPAGGTLDASQAHGRQIFIARCASCHSGPYFTDSAAGDPSLDLCGSVALHDIGTCDLSADGGFADQASMTYDAGCQRAACMFDTPTLRGVFATAPYFHDGRAQTLDEAVAYFDRFLALGLSAADQADLVAYLKTL